MVSHPANTESKPNNNRKPADLLNKEARGFFVCVYFTGKRKEVIYNQLDSQRNGVYLYFDLDYNDKR